MSKIEQLLSIQLNNRIQQIISTNNAENFFVTYKTFHSFLSSPYGGAFQHFRDIASCENIYQNVCTQIKSELNINTANDEYFVVEAPISESEKVEGAPKTKVKTYSKTGTGSKISGFVDTLILAFIIVNHICQICQIHPQLIITIKIFKLILK